MSIMALRGSRFLRSIAITTLLAFLAGCIPQNIREGGGTAVSSTSALTSSAGSLLTSLKDMTSSVKDMTGVDLPGAGKDGTTRRWTKDDQANAEEAQAAFLGKELDDLPVYDPLKPGEAQRYREKISELNARYKGRETLTQAEMLEVSRAVVPVMRYMVKSRTYRESMKKLPAIQRNRTGQSSVTIPAGMTMDIALLTYCADSRLPAPWRGEKLQMRDAGLYMPRALVPLFQDLHSYAATRPSAHYLMQRTVWWMRDTPCDDSRLSDQQKALIEAARPGGLDELSAHCSQQKMKGQIFEAGKQFIPGVTAASDMLAQAQQYVSTAEDFNGKAQAFLNADLQNPSELLALAQSTGLSDLVGASNILRDPTVQKLAPVLQQSGLLQSLIPASVDDKAAASTLAVMEELGRQIGAEQGVDSTGIAQYSKLDNGLYVESVTPGGAKNAIVKVRNTGPYDLTFVGSDYVLSSVDDPNSTHKRYRPTQALSIGPMQPQRIYPNEPDAARRYTQAHENEAKRVLEGLAIDAPLESGHDTAAEEKCVAAEKVQPGSGTMRFGDFGLGIIRDVVQTVPLLGNVAYGYSAITGKDWMTGASLSLPDRAVAAVGAALPMAGLVGGVTGGIRAGKTLRGAWTGFKSGDEAAALTTTGIRMSQAGFSITGKDACGAWAAGAAAINSQLCATAKSFLTCPIATAFSSAIGGVQKVRRDTDEEAVERAFARLEYALAPDYAKPIWKPAILDDTLGRLRGVLP